MIKVKNIRKTFKEDFWSKPQVVLDNINFTIKTGELIGFLGVNGAGKTTFLKILMNFISSDSGEIEFSKELGRQSEILSNIGFLPERPYLYPYLKGREFLNFIAELNSIPNNVLNERVIKWTQRLRIDDALDKRLKDYSKGMLQRIGFASILITAPKIVFLDEPLAGLDPIGRKEFKDIMREVNEEGVTIFFSSHIVNDVEEICSRAVVLESGKIVYDGLISKLMKKNQSNKYRVKVELKNKFVIPAKYNILSIEENVALVELDATDREIFLNLLMEKQQKLISFSPKHVSLEDVIYGIES
ncbi:MAG: ABC transporter ATP-binding protein [Bacteriovoracaceae bacterium]|jgi:ABC-2 type transport system ATP-binding protein|nr:ABC transporter ATP-binding protein [Bacteriovoracaceae bacterium]